MKTTFLISTFFILISVNLFAQWYQQTPPTTQFNAMSVQFLNANIGWAGGGFVLLKSVDGGTNWNQQTTPPNYNIQSMHFISEQKGWLVGGLNQIVFTTDGGTNWNSHILNLPFVFYSVFFINENVGWIAGDGGKILKTTNGGTNWTEQTSNLTKALKVIYFMNENLGWVGGGSDYARTTDGGATWTKINAFSELRDIQFIDANNGYATSTTGANNLVLKTTDSGLTWQDGPPLTVGVGYRYSIHFTDLNTGYAVGYSFLMIGSPGIQKTTDGGASWVTQTLNPDLLGGTFMSVQFIDANTGWAVGSLGAIYKTTNGGVTFVGDENGSLPNEFSLEQNYPNPFNPSTRISWHSPVSGHQTLKIFDMLGNEVATLVDEYREAGSYGVEFNSVKTLRTSASLSNRATSLPSGIYFYKLRAGNFSETKKMILTK